MARKVPEFRTDQDAIDFMEGDLSDIDVTQFKPVTFEFQAKSARLDMRIPERLLDAVKRRADQKGVPVNHYVRELMERDILQSQQETPLA